MAGYSTHEPEIAEPPSHDFIACSGSNTVCHSNRASIACGPDANIEKCSKEVQEKYILASASTDLTKTLLEAQNDDDPPDGGLRAWVVLFGTMCFTFTTFGYVNSWGVFQAYYEQTLLRNSSPSSIAWIGSLQYSLIVLPSLFISRLFELGYFHTVLVTASVIFIVATFLIAECKQYWQFLLCQGLVTGLVCGVFFGPLIGIIAQWFKRRRGLALGLFTAGSSIGSTVIPVITRLLINRIGFPWTMRVIAFVLLIGIVMGNLTLKQRRRPTVSKGKLLRMSTFQSPAFIVYCLGTLFLYFGYLTFLTYVAASAVSSGISADFAFYLVSIANACNGAGRLLFGRIADRAGALNLIIPFTIFTALVNYAWPFATSKGSLMTVTVLYGFFAAAYGALMSYPILELGDPADLTQRVGVLMTCLGLGGLAGPPVSGAVEQNSGTQAMGFYAGSMILLGVVFMCITRQMIIGRRFWVKI